MGRWPPPQLQTQPSRASQPMKTASSDNQRNGQPTYMEHTRQEVQKAALPDKFEMLKQCTAALEQQLVAMHKDQRALVQQQMAMQNVLDKLGNTVAALTKQMTTVQQQLGEILKAVNNLMAVQVGQQAHMIASTTTSSSHAKRQLAASLQVPPSPEKKKTKTFQ